MQCLFHHFVHLRGPFLFLFLRPVHRGQPAQKVCLWNRPHFRAADFFLRSSRTPLLPALGLFLVICSFLQPALCRWVESEMCPPRPRLCLESSFPNRWCFSEALGTSAVVWGMEELVVENVSLGAFEVVLDPVGLSSLISCEVNSQHELSSRTLSSPLRRLKSFDKEIVLPLWFSARTQKSGDTPGPRCSLCVGVCRFFVGVCGWLPLATASMSHVLLLRLACVQSCVRSGESTRCCS